MGVTSQADNANRSKNLFLFSQKQVIWLVPNIYKCCALWCISKYLFPLSFSIFLSLQASFSISCRFFIREGSPIFPFCLYLFDCETIKFVKYHQRWNTKLARIKATKIANLHNYFCQPINSDDGYKRQHFKTTRSLQSLIQSNRV